MQAWPRWKRTLGWSFMVLFGPLHFTGELVGPSGAVAWKQLICAFLGSTLWGAVIWWLFLA